MHYFCDLDGVLADFSQHFLDHFGLSDAETNDQKLWELVFSLPDFFRTIPLKDGARELWALLAPYKPTILTGCPTTNFDRVAAHKREWVAEHFGPTVPVITCRARNKPLYMVAPGDVLIDDFVRNIIRWETAGGVGIRYRSAAQTLPVIRDLLAQVAA